MSLMGQRRNACILPHGTISITVVVACVGDLRRSGDALTRTGLFDSVLVSLSSKTETNRRNVTVACRIARRLVGNVTVACRIARRLVGND